MSKGQFSLNPRIGLLALAAAALIPLLCKGGICVHTKLATAIALCMAIFFGGVLCLVFIEFVTTSGEKAPNRGGQPIVFIVAMALFALLFFCPWLLTALRGFSALRIKSDAQQAAPSNR